MSQLAIPVQDAVVDVFAGFADTTTREYNEGVEQLQSQNVDVASFLAWVQVQGAYIFLNSYSFY